MRLISIKRHKPHLFKKYDQEVTVYLTSGIGIANQ